MARPANRLTRTTARRTGRRRGNSAIAVLRPCPGSIARGIMIAPFSGKLAAPALRKAGLRFGSDEPVDPRSLARRQGSDLRRFRGARAVGGSAVLHVESFIELLELFERLELGDFRRFDRH